MAYLSEDWHPCRAEDEIVCDEGGDVLRGVFDDRSFPELSQLDLARYDDVDIKINLTEIRHLDLRRLLGGNWCDSRIRIRSHNCIIDNLPCVIAYDPKKRLYVEIQMDFCRVTARPVPASSKTRNISIP